MDDMRAPLEFEMDEYAVHENDILMTWSVFQETFKHRGKFD